MKNVSWKIVGILALALVLSTVALTMMFGGLGTTMSRLALIVIVFLLCITCVKLIGKKEKPTADTTTSATTDATVAPVTPAADATVAPVTPATDATTVSYDDVVNMLSQLNHYYSEKSSVTIADETACLQVADELRDTLKKTCDLYNQAQQKRRDSEQRVEELVKFFNPGNQNP